MRRLMADRADIGRRSLVPPSEIRTRRAPRSEGYRTQARQGFPRCPLTSSVRAVLILHIVLIHDQGASGDHMRDAHSGDRRRARRPEVSQCLPCLHLGRLPPVQFRYPCPERHQSQDGRGPTPPCTGAAARPGRNRNRRVRTPGSLPCGAGTPSLGARAQGPCPLRSGSPVVFQDLSGLNGDPARHNGSINP